MKAPNYASNKEYAEQMLAKMCSIWNDLRGSRNARERQWMDAYYAWSSGPGGEDFVSNETQSARNYIGRANIRVPQLRKEIETMTRRLVKGLFREDYISALPNGLEDEKDAQVNAMIVRHYFDNKMNLKQSVTPWLKQNVTLGTSPMRTYWCKETNKQMFKKRHFVQNEQGILIPKSKTVYEEVTLYDAPVAEACDLFQTWVYPDTAQNPSQIQAVFFRTNVDLEYLKKMEAEGCYILPEGIENMGKEVTQEFEKTQERLQEFGASGTRPTLPGQKSYTLLQCWAKVLFPGQKHPTAAIVEIIDEAHCIRIQQNPYWFQAPPFVFARYILPFPGDFYGRGLPEVLLAMQSQLDDVMNQSMDSVTLTLNPLTIVDPSAAPNADSFEVEPGGIWWANPQAIKQFTFPDLSDVGIKNAGMLKGMISELSDNQPQIPDPIAGKARSTGQAELAIGEWQTDLFNFIEQISVEALNPFTGMVHSLIQQNISDDTVIKITGKLANEYIYKVATPEDLIGRYDFKWIGSIQSESQSVKTQQMLNLLKILPSIPPNAGIKINWQNFMIRVLKEGFQLRNVEEIVETDRMKSSVPPLIENRILEMGGNIEVRHSDNDDIHINFHRLAESSPDALVRSKMAQHIAEHELQKRNKAQEAAMQQMMMQAQQVQGNGPSNPMGNQAQLSEATDSANLQRGLRG
jgi:hypothetical protein